MRKLTVCLILFVFSLNGGCKLIGLMSSPTPHEKKIPAEYKLAELKDEKILVLVSQPVWLNAEVDFRSSLTEEIRKHLVDKAKVRSENIIGYEKLLEFRATQPDFSYLSPSEVGQALDAEFVLFVLIEDHELSKTAETNYYKGSLGAKAVLIDISTKAKIWPQSEEAKFVRVGFELEPASRDTAISRLSKAFAYCLTRYFYDCPMAKFRILDDRSDTAWGQWD